MIEYERVIDVLPWPTPVEVVAVARALLGKAPLAYADCQRCGAPAHPIRGYCGRFCEEAARYDAEPKLLWWIHDRDWWAPHVPHCPVTPEETTAAYAEAYAALERDINEASVRDARSMGYTALAATLDDPRTFGGKP